MAGKAVSLNVSETPVATDIPCRVVSFYDEATARDPLVRFWDILAKKLEGEVEFEFYWWKYKFLADARLARVAAQEAAQADIVIFARRTGGELPVGLQEFNDLWLKGRQTQPGLLLAICDSALGLKRGAIAFQVHLREVAKRAQMEYWLQFFSPPAAVGAAESLESLMRRADHVSPLLEEILQRSRHPSHWGINE